MNAHTALSLGHESRLTALPEPPIEEGGNVELSASRRRDNDQEIETHSDLRIASGSGASWPPTRNAGALFRSGVAQERQEFPFE